jgi:peptidoglycan/LPS O-acetylase OafA/YrhL
VNNLTQASQSLYHRIRAALHWVYQRLSRLLEDQQQSAKNTIAVLDGVRACAILFVIIFHINRTTGDNLWSRTDNPLATSVSTAGGTGVTLFFVLSGFLLFMPYAKALLFKTRWPLARVYYLRRVLRIVPGYYISLFLIILLFQPAYLHPDHFKDLALFLTFYMDSSQSTFRQINGPFWTLATEWQFYMILPLLALAFALVVKRVPMQRRLQAVTLCLMSLILWGLFVRCCGFYYTQNPMETFLVPRSVLNVILFFSFGITGKYTEDFAVGMFVSLCYIYTQHPSSGEKLNTMARRLSLWLWRGGIIILVFSAVWHFNHEMHGWPFLNGLYPYYDWLSEMVLAVGYGACIAAILFGHAALKRPFEWPLLRWIGLISYSLYIWHLPLIIVFRDHVLPNIHSLNTFTTYGLYWLWAFVVIFPFAFFCYVLVEKPWMKLGDQWRRGIEKREAATDAINRESCLGDRYPTQREQAIKL